MRIYFLFYRNNPRFINPWSLNNNFIQKIIHPSLLKLICFQQGSAAVQTSVLSYFCSLFSPLNFWRLLHFLRHIWRILARKSTCCTTNLFRLSWAHYVFKGDYCGINNSNANFSNRVYCDDIQCSLTYYSFWSLAARYNLRFLSLRLAERELYRWSLWRILKIFIPVDKMLTWLCAIHCFWRQRIRYRLV